jgi:hypothetical protein
MCEVLLLRRIAFLLLILQSVQCLGTQPSKESTKAAFQKAFSTYMLLNLSPEQEVSLTAYGKSEERLRMEQQLKQEPVDRKDGED